MRLQNSDIFTQVCDEVVTTASDPEHDEKHEDSDDIIDNINSASEELQVLRLL